VYAGGYKLECTKCSKWTAEQRKHKGCDGPAPYPLFVTEDGEEIFECPGKLITQDTRAFLSIFSACEQLHCLPVAGGLIDQTAYFCHSASVVGGIVSEVLNDKVEDVGNA
jgi:hypothetical protein